MKKILIVLTSHSELGATGKKTGAYLPEVAHPYDVFVDAGLHVDFASIRGGRAPLDGLDAKDESSQRFLADPHLQARLRETPALANLDPAEYAAIFFAGGHGTMWDFPEDSAVARVAGAVYERGGVVAAVCHGPAALLAIQSNGAPIVREKRVAAFTNAEEEAVGLTNVVPFLLADALTAQGAKHEPAPNFKANVVVDGRLVTGQNPASARPVAEAVARLVSA
ncbi:MAG: type 1 glutamine amidotransferase domain-containing protein [Polyangiaceae bacterium]